MSDLQHPPPPADGEGFRLSLDDERMRIDGLGVTIDVPLSLVEDCMASEAAGGEWFDLRMCVEIKVNEVIMRHRRNPSGPNVVRRAWEAARHRTASITTDTVDETSKQERSDPALEAAPESVVDEPESAGSQGEPVPPIGGPALLAGGPEWLTFEPLEDTRLLAVAALLVHDDRQGA